MGYLLMRAGEPPFVLSLANAAAYFAASAVIRQTPKHGVAMRLRVVFARRRLAALLHRDAKRRYLFS
jgi:hypothetical protein